MELLEQILLLEERRAVKKGGEASELGSPYANAVAITLSILLSGFGGKDI